MLLLFVCPCIYRQGMPLFKARSVKNCNCHCSNRVVLYTFWKDSLPSRLFSLYLQVYVRYHHVVIPNVLRAVNVYLRSLELVFVWSIQILDIQLEGGYGTMPPSIFKRSTSVQAIIIFSSGFCQFVGHNYSLLHQSSSRNRFSLADEGIAYLKENFIFKCYWIVYVKCATRIQLCRVCRGVSVVYAWLWKDLVVKVQGRS